LPKEFPLFSTVQRFFYRWRERGCGKRLTLPGDAGACGGAAKPAPQPGSSAASRSKPPRPAGHGYHAGKKVKGRKCHILTDTNGVLVAAVVHPANTQDRDGAPLVLASTRYLYPWLRHVLPTAPTAAPSSMPRSIRSAGGRSRSSNAPMPPPDLSSCPAAGWSSAPLRGSTATAASPRTLRPPSTAPGRGCFSPSVKLLMRRLGRILQPNVAI